MNPIAKELNEIILDVNPHIYDMLSRVGKELYFPRGILSQSAEAKEKAHKYNATIGMATEKGRTMCLHSVMNMIQGFEPEESITYAPSYGIKPLRDVWKETMMEKNPSLIGKEISLPLVTNAITHGLSVVSDVWVDPGDAIILPDKMWGNYNMIFTVRRSAEIIQYPLFSPNGGFNLQGFDKRVMEEAKRRHKLIILLNFPNNPTGYTISPSEGEGIADILTRAAVVDDAYFGLVYEDNVLRESISSILIGRDPRLLTIKLDGATKESYAWGLRVGFITYGASFGGQPRPLYDALERKTGGDIRGSISNASHLSQSIILKSLTAGTFASEKMEKYKIMKDRVQELKHVLMDTKYDKIWKMYPFNSGYFMCLQLKTVEAEPLRVHLLDKYGVGLISLGKTDLRVAFSCIEKENIRDLFDTIYNGIKDLE